MCVCVCVCSLGKCICDKREVSMMAECTVVHIDREASGMAHRVVCETWGLERLWKVSDSKLCDVVARNVALEEVKEVRGLLGEARQQLGEVRQQLLEQRGLGSVRSRVRVEPGQSLREQEESGWRFAVRRGKEG